MNKLVSFPYVSIFVEHNPHKLNDETVESYLDFAKPRWRSDTERDEAIKRQDIWVMQCYPDTPVRFFRIAAATLEDLLVFAEMCGERPENAQAEAAE